MRFSTTTTAVGDSADAVFTKSTISTNTTVADRMPSAITSYRSKDIIISGGENISSLEVEDVLYRHPAVLACAVIARPDERWGETPCAYVEIKADAQVTAEELIAHCRAQLAHFKAPRHIEFATLPKTSTGKIQKAVLRAAEKAALSANKDADAPSG